MNDRRIFILEKTFDLFMQYGIKSVSMDDISTKLGISKKTLYQHVRDKAELVENSLQFSKDSFQCNFNVYNDDSLNAIEQHYNYRQNMKDKVSLINPSFMFDLRKYYPLLYDDMTRSKKETLYLNNRNNLEKGIQEGFYRSDIDVDIIARIILSYHTLIFNPSNGVFSDQECISFDVWDKAMSYHFYGVCSEKGMNEWERLFKEEDKK